MRINTSRALRIIFCAGIFSALFCALRADDKVLRVGISPTDPPMQYMDGNKTVGLEAEFAAALGKELGRKVEFVDMKFGKLIPSLLDNDVDIIMSAMSVTAIRSLQIAFCDPYAKIGQMALVRAEDARLYNSPKDIVMTDKVVGAKESTTGQFLVTQEFSNAKKRFFATPEKGAAALKRKDIDVLILDSPFVLWLAIKNEGVLTPMPVLFTEEELAWGVRKSDTELREAANRALAKWKKSGQMDEMVKKWVPHL